MLYRAIARIGISNNNNTIHLTQDVRRWLKDAGFENTRTGTHETQAMELGDINACFNHLLTELAGIDDASAPCLKHLWLYIDGPVIDVEAVVEGVLDEDDEVSCAEDV